jgi:hypothetical protein
MVRSKTNADPQHWFTKKFNVRKWQEELKLKTVLRIRDVYPGSRVRTVFIPDPGSASKNLSILTQKNGF